jgi:TRAP-type C4-dicarboxylate transport system substrate-binding protein
MGGLRTAARGSLCAALLLCATAIGAAALADDQPVQLKLSHWVPPSHPLQKAIQDWADDLKKESGGSLTSVIFPAQQLGKAFDHYDMARDGIADFAYVNPGYQPGRFPIIAAAELPFLFANAKGGSAALDEWYRPYAAREMKDVHYCLAFVHDPGTLHSHKQVLLPADMRGLKVRPADGTIGEMVTLLGGTNIQAAAPQARDILERGVADAITFPWGSLVLFGIDKVLKYHMDVKLYVTTFVWVMNQAKYDSLSGAQKKAVDDHCNTEWAERMASPWADFERAGRDKVAAEPGHVVYPLDADQLAAWRKAVTPVKDEWAAAVKKAGAGDPDAIFDGLQAALKKRDSAY